MAEFKEAPAGASVIEKTTVWFENRFPTAFAEYKKHMSEYYAPKNFNTWYFFGSLALLVLVIPIEFISKFLVQPFSHTVRLFANMLAGHITLKVFAGFVVTLAGLGVAGIGGAIVPLIMTVALTALEFLVAFLQAYVFTILTCMYLNDALHPGH